jgi:small neutral amino acid transporter SnatA (MarC family)
MIGPGTVSASVVTGARLDAWPAVLAISVALTGAAVGLLAIKFLHDFVRRRNQALVERYIDLVGRMSALVIGTIAIEMIYQGIKLYIDGGAITEVMPEAVGG